MNTYGIRSSLVSTLGVALALVSGSALAITFGLIDLGMSGLPIRALTLAEYRCPQATFHA